jgi:thiamine biosynthesis lipoprotein
MVNARYRLILLVALAALTGCAREASEVVISGPTMGTTYTVRVVAPPEAVDEHALRAGVDEVLSLIDRQASGYRTDSDVVRFNASTSTDWIAAPRELAEIARIANEVSTQSGGAFDITVAPLVQAWGFGAHPTQDALPHEAQLAAIREHIGYTKLRVRAQPSALRKDIAALTIDLNGVAPGYAVDLLAQKFIQMGVERFLIELGGEVRARGRNARGEWWRVAVERPIDTAQIPYAVVRLENLAVTTSGEYRRFRELDGRRYSHTIDPRTGRPVGHTLASVVVMGASAAQNDAWATALNVLGPEEGFALATQLDLAALFIERRGATLTHRATKRFAPHVVSFHNDNEGQP